MSHLVVGSIVLWGRTQQEDDDMKKLLLSGAAALVLTASIPAYAMTYYLVTQWFENGNNMCKYGNGTVLNVGARVCPLSIQG